MEPSNKFDLSFAIHHWLEAVLAHNTLTEGNRLELEDHLQTAIAAHVAAGLSEEAAFGKAIAAFGNPEMLSREFQKANRHLPLQRNLVAAGAGLMGLLTLWIGLIFVLSLASFLGMQLRIPTHIMVIGLPLLEKLFAIVATLSLLWAFFRPLELQHKVQDMLRLHPNRPIHWLLGIWLGTLSTHLLTWRAIPRKPDGWQAWDLQDLDVLDHDAFMAVAAIVSFLGLVLVLVRGPKKMFHQLLWLVAGASSFPASSFLFRWVPSAKWLDLATFLLFLIANIVTALYLRKFSRQRLWLASAQA